MKKSSPIQFSILLSLLCWGTTALAQNASVTRPAEIRAEKLASSAVLAQVNQGANVRITSVEGGWVLVEAAADKGLCLQPLLLTPTRPLQK